jgi:hypothetical protein
VPTACAADSDCVPLNCCYAQTEHSCIPKGRANCDKFAIECDDAGGPRYACTCDKGACVGKWSMGGNGPGAAGPDAGPYGSQMSIATGALSTGAVLDVIMKHGPDVRACHARARNATGLATLSWNVSNTGAVDKPMVVTTTGLDPKLTSCLTKKIGGWRFPKAKGPTRVMYAFRFTRS